MESIETTIILNLAGQKQNFIFNVENTFKNNFKFYVCDAESKGIVLDGWVSDGKEYWSYSIKSVQYFSEAIDKKVKIELKKLAKINKIKLSIK